MINSKDMTRKVHSACGHSKPIIVPCAECTEKNLAAWESAIRSNTKESLKGDWQQMQVEVQQAEKRAKDAESVADRLKVAVSTLERANETYRMQLRAAKAEISDLKLRIDTEQVSHIMSRMPLVIE